MARERLHSFGHSFSKLDAAGARDRRAVCCFPSAARLTSRPQLTTLQKAAEDISQQKFDYLRQGGVGFGRSDPIVVTTKLRFGAKADKQHF